MPEAATLEGPVQRSPRGLVIFAGPLAWFIELNIGYALATEPCFPTDQRLVLPTHAWAWTRAGLLALAAVCVLVALGAFLRSVRLLREQSAGRSTVRVGSRPQFAALWGALFGGGFLVATLLTGVGLIVLPRCGG